MKAVFTRARPNQGGNPDLWFQGKGNYSFPSGEVMEITTAITPYVLEYGAEHPAVWALELLPAYDAVARVRSQAHWQSDVLASFAIGTVLGYYAHSRTSSFTVGVLPHGLDDRLEEEFLSRRGARVSDRTAAPPVAHTARPRQRARHAFRFRRSRRLP